MQSAAQHRYRFVASTLITTAVKMLRCALHDVPLSISESLMVMMLVGLVGLAEKVDEGADHVKARPAHIKPVEAGRGMAHKKMQNQMRPGTHQQAREGDELEAVEGRGAV